MLYTNLWLEIDVDLSEGKTLEVLYVKQFEHNIKRIKVNLFYNGEKVIVPTTGNGARLNASVGDETTAYQMAAYLPVSDEENYVYFPLYSELTSKAGVEHCEIEIYKSSTGNNIYTPTFDLIVEPSVATSAPPEPTEQEIVQHGFIEIKGNGLTIINNFDLSNCTMFEYCACVKFTTAPDPSVVYSLFGSKLTHYALPSLEIGQNGIIGRISSDGSTWSNYQDEWAIDWSNFLNNFLFLKLRYADGKAAIYSSTDGVNFTARTTPTACSAPYAGGNDYNKLLLGGGGETSDHAFTVFSDTEGLNVFNSYVKLNGTVVWGRQIAGEITDDE